MDDFYIEDSTPKHIILKCLGILFVIGICIGVFLFYKYKHTIKLKNVTIELGEKLSTNVEDYLLSGIDYSDSYKLDLSDVDTNSVGSYKYFVSYNKHVVSGKISIKDTTIPVVETNDVTMNVKEDLEARLLVSDCDDISLPCSVVFKDENIVKKFKTPGVYVVDIIVSDSQGNKVEKSAKVTSSETGTLSTIMSSDLEYYTNNLNDDTIEHILFEKFDVAMDDDSHEFVTIHQEVSALDFTQYTDDIYSMKLLIAYNKYGYVIGLQVIVTHSDGTIEYLTKGDN